MLECKHRKPKLVGPDCVTPRAGVMRGFKAGAGTEGGRLWASVKTGRNSTVVFTDHSIETLNLVGSPHALLGHREIGPCRRFHRPLFWTISARQ